MGRRTTRPGEQVRVPLEQAIALRFKQSGEFDEEQSANISTGGMFIQTRSPQPVGAVLEFELRLDDKMPPIAGKAQVAWVRRRSADGSQPTGMGVRFVEIPDESRRQIDRLVAGHSGSKAAAADTGTATTAPPEPQGAGAPAAATAGAGAGRTAAIAKPPPVATAAEPERRALRLPWILVAIALAAAMAAAFWSQTGGDRATAKASPPIPTLAAPEPNPAPPTAAGERNATTDQPPQVQAVLDWARAWSEQRIDDYLAAYSPDFIPADGLDRASWERQRRDRILSPRRIDVRLAFVELEEIGPDSSRVRFVQAYESEAYRDVVRKVLELERRQGGWKILSESQEP